MEFLKVLKIQAKQAGSAAGTTWLIDPKAPLFPSINPSNEEVIAEVSYATEVDYRLIVEKSVQAFHLWREVPAPKRAELVKYIAKLIQEKKNELGALISLETGKTLAEGLGEVQEILDIADFSIGLARMLYGKTMPSEREQHRLYEQWQPLGVVGVITAFNFPMAVWSWNAFIAAVCGDTVIWKPSHKTPLCAIALQHICQQAMQALGYEGIFSLITAHRDLANRLVEDPHVPLISFTGSVKAGKEVAAKVADRLGKSILELGGNNAVIVDESANLSLAIPAIVFGAVGTAGQRCTTTRRVIIHEAIYDKVVNSLITAYKQISIGDPLDTGNLMGPLIDQEAVALFIQTLEEIKIQQGKILFGGKIINRKGFFVEPTLVTAENHWPVVQRESFVPILYLMTFKTIQEAIDLHNAVPQGLSSSIFTNDYRHAELFVSARGSDCGLANINLGTSGAEIGGAFGGEKQTGGGRESGSDAWKAYMRRQTSAVSWGDAPILAQGIKFN